MAFKRKEYHKEENCLNCGYPLIGKFCAQCGQKAFLHKDSFMHMVVHFVGDYFHYDNKFWLTIKTLFMKPGLATIEYIQGKRVKYLNPLQLYIFITTVFFLVAMSNDSDEKKKIVQKPLTKQQQDSLIAYKKTLVGINTADGENRIGIGNLTPNEPTREAYDSVQQSLPPAKRDGFFVTRIRRKSFSHSNDIGEQLQHHFSKVFFLLLPLFAMFLAFLFRKQKLFYVDHLIFSVHFHCMLFNDSCKYPTHQYLVERYLRYHHDYRPFCRLTHLLIYLPEKGVSLTSLENFYKAIFIVIALSLCLYHCFLSFTFYYFHFLLNIH